jgi:RNA polymerase sigma-70 factor, ECF subfamily
MAALRAKRESAKVVRLVPSPRSAGPSIDDAAILAALRAGDPAAASALHARVRPVVEATIRRLLGRADSEHDDLAQVSLIEVVRSLDRFRGECSLDTWVSRVSAHTVFKELRRRRVEHAVFDRSTPSDGADSRGGDLEESTLERSLVARVREHLDAMSPDRAFTVVLHDVCGHDLREVAEIMDVSVAAAQSRLVRGRRELHDRIARDPELAERLQQQKRRDADG